MRDNGTYLHVAFGNIKWGDAGVGETACKNTTKHALGIVRSVVGDRAKMPGDASSVWCTDKRIMRDSSPGIPLSRRGEVRHERVINWGRR
jgi:hypothetical protein